MNLCIHIVFTDSVCEFHYGHNIFLFLFLNSAESLKPQIEDLKSESEPKWSKTLRKSELRIALPISYGILITQDQRNFPLLLTET